MRLAVFGLGLWTFERRGERDSYGLIKRPVRGPTLPPAGGSSMIDAPLIIVTAEDHPSAHPSASRQATKF